MADVEREIAAVSSRSVPGRKLRRHEFRRELVRHVFFGAAVGLSAGLIRERIVGNIHWETLIALFLLLLLGVRLAVGLRRIVPKLEAHLVLSASVALLWVAFMLAMLLASAEIRTAVFEDFITKSPILAISSIGVANMLLWIIQVARPPRVGPHCDACGYDIRGLPEPRCPECGRELTQPELARACEASG